jgi:hypothetical protein
MEENSFLIKPVNTMLDISLNEAIFAYERLREKMLDDNKKEMAQLSAPIVPIREGIAILPLIGAIDHYRAEYIMDNVLHTTFKLPHCRLFRHLNYRYRSCYLSESSSKCTPLVRSKSNCNRLAP